MDIVNFRSYSTRGNIRNFCSYQVFIETVEVFIFTKPILVILKCNDLSYTFNVYIVEIVIVRLKVITLDF